MARNQHFVFVYGTLLSSQRNNDRLRGAEFLYKAKTVQKYRMSRTDNGESCIPYVNPDRRVHTIKGEVYSVDNDLLRLLDRFEGHPHFYHREKTWVEIDETGTQFEAWIYFYDRDPNGNLVRHGDFAAHMDKARGRV